MIELVHQNSVLIREAIFFIREPLLGIGLASLCVCYAVMLTKPNCRHQLIGGNLAIGEEAHKEFHIQSIGDKGAVNNIDALGFITFIIERSISHHYTMRKTLSVNYHLIHIELYYIIYIIIIYIIIIYYSINIYFRVYVPLSKGHLNDELHISSLNRECVRCQSAYGVPDPFPTETLYTRWTPHACVL